MKYLAIVLLALLAGCSNSDTSTATTAATVPVSPDSPRFYPTVMVDVEHNKLIEPQANVAVESDPLRDLSVLTSSNWLRITDTNKLAAYQISAASGIWLNCSRYHFSSGSNAVPNMVQMILGNSVYKLYWPVETNIYIINSVTMQPAEGERFLAFHSGDHADIAIGRWIEGYDKTNFLVSWAGQIDVK